MNDINANSFGYVVVTDYIKANTGEDVSDALQELILNNPHRTIYFPDGEYILAKPICTPAHPERSVSLMLSNYAILRAADGWDNEEAMVRMGGINRQQAREHQDKNIITRAIGAEDELKIDFFKVKLEKGDFILLCSDGLTNMIEDEEIRMLLLGQKDVVSKAETLVAAANRNGGKDNISVVLIEPFADEVNK
jgi:hypothetical protein